MLADVIIDGSQGEGGGQMVRSSMALSIVTGRSLQVLNIRARRPRPGLMRQHLTSVQAAAEICGGQLHGAELGATEIAFTPGRVKGGQYQFRIGSAGSAMLVLQTILPPLLIADQPSTVIVEGGTHNMAAPPFDFLQKVWIPLVNQMGPAVSARLERYGFYPAGGGRIVVNVSPSEVLKGFNLLERGLRIGVTVKAMVANLPESIGDREVQAVTRKLSWSNKDAIVESVAANGPGNVVYASLQYANINELCTAFGRAGVPAERVAADVVKQVRRYLKHDAPVGEHLADQILLPLGISAHQYANLPAHEALHAGGTFASGPLSQHARTHIEILQRFLNINIQVAINKVGATVCLSPR